MYPSRELNQLAVRRQILRRRIARHRRACVTAATELARPITWLDQPLAFWRKLTPLARFALPALGAFAVRKIFPGRKILGLAWRWGPWVAAAVRALRSAGNK